MLGDSNMFAPVIHFHSLNIEIILSRYITKLVKIKEPQKPSRVVDLRAEEELIAAYYTLS